MAPAKETELLEQYRALAVKVDLHNQVEVKYALDDFVRLAAVVLCGLKQDNKFMDAKLVLGYLACLIAGAGSLYSYYTPFEQTKLVLLVSVISYFILTTISTYVVGSMEGTTIFLARKLDPTGLDPPQLVAIKAEMPRCDIVYTLLASVTDEASSSPPTAFKVELRADKLFDWDGHLLPEAVLQELRPLLGPLSDPLSSSKKHK